MKELWRLFKTYHTTPYNGDGEPQTALFNTYERLADYAFHPITMNSFVLLGAVFYAVIIVSFITEWLLDDFTIAYDWFELDFKYGSAWLFILSFPIGLFFTSLIFPPVLWIAITIWPLWVFIGILFIIKWWRSYERPIKQPKQIDETERYQQELLSNFK